MKQKCLAISLALFIIFASTVSVFATELQTIFVNAELWSENFENFSTKVKGFEVVADPTKENSENRVLKLEYDARSEYLVFPTELDSSTSYSIHMKLLCTPDDRDFKLWYLQVGAGSSASLQLEFWSSPNHAGKYQIRVNNKPITSYEAFRYDSFNDITFELDKLSNNFTVSVNDDPTIVKSYEELGWNESAVEANTAFLRLYMYNTGGKAIYFDDLRVDYQKKVEFDPDELQLEYQLDEISYGAESRAITLSGKVSQYLQQKAYLKLINQENPEEMISWEQNVIDEGDGASFAFSEVLPNSVSGWYYIVVDSDYITAPEEERTEKIYIATLDELKNLPNDFSSLPEDLEEAKRVVENYLPCLIPEKEIDYVKENLEFITKYFKNSEIDFQTIVEVQENYKKAVFYLELTKAEGEELKTLLDDNGFLETYVDDAVLTEYETEFFAHFDRQRKNNALLSDELVKNALHFSCALTHLNHAKRSEIAEIIETYNDVFGLDVTSDSVKKLNQDELYASLYSKNYIDIDELKKDWEETIQQLTKEDEKEERPSKPSSGGSSSGSGGGGVSGIFITDETISPLEIAPPAENEEANKMFSDIEGHWAQQAIIDLADKGIVNGFLDGSFCPDATLTRAEFSTMLVRAVPSLKKAKEILFYDISETDWFYTSVKTVAEAGVVLGADGYFMPNDSITREQLAAMIYRLIQPEETAEEILFDDRDDISDYAISAVAYLVKKGYLSGYEDNTIRPKANITRAETAKLLSILVSDLIA